MELVFLGTSAGGPTLARSASAVALRLGAHAKRGSTWLFDCGEGTYRQLLATPVSHAAVDRIFVSQLPRGIQPDVNGRVLDWFDADVRALRGELDERNARVQQCAESTSTRPSSRVAKLGSGPPEPAVEFHAGHLHGDHLWGLPGVVVSALLEQRGRRHLHVYGPEGLHEYLSTTLSISRFAPPKSGSRCIVTELPSTLRRPPPRPLKPRSHPAVEYRAAEHFDGETSSTIVDDGARVVTATPIRHTPAVDCFAFVVTEKAGKRRVDAAKATALGLPPGDAYQRLQDGEDVPLGDGRVVRAADCTSPPPRPRRVAILGDTYDASAAVDAARGADVVVHEATMADGDAAVARAHGHATGAVAGNFARAAGASALVLTHFSAKFRLGGRGGPPAGTTDVLVDEARRAFGGDRVLAAYDYMTVAVPRGGYPRDPR